MDCVYSRPKEKAKRIYYGFSHKNCRYHTSRFVMKSVFQSHCRICSQVVAEISEKTARVTDNYEKIVSVGSKPGKGR